MKALSKTLTILFSAGILVLGGYATAAYKFNKPQLVADVVTCQKVILEDGKAQNDFRRALRAMQDEATGDDFLVELTKKGK